ncbi:MAG: hypothetical protein LC804_13690 [Acidobacteria bacterium]|nr:hypothetical protein [Acidobacteriota bacterium]
MVSVFLTAAVLAVRSDKAMYIGGTLSGLREKTEGPVTSNSMTHLKVCAVSLMWLGTFAVAAGQVQRAHAGCPDTDRVVYSAATAEVMQEVSIASMDASSMKAAIRGLEARKSLHGTAAYFVRKPDTTQNGPWTTTVYIRGNEARPIDLAIRFSNHASYGVLASWLSEKLLFLQVWRGRIVSTDLILDVDAKQFVYREAANYGILIRPCDSRPKK